MFSAAAQTTSYSIIVQMAVCLCSFILVILDKLKPMCETNSEFSQIQGNCEKPLKNIVSEESFFTCQYAVSVHTVSLLTLFVRCSHNAHCVSIFLCRLKCLLVQSTTWIVTDSNCVLCVGVKPKAFSYSASKASSVQVDCYSPYFVCESSFLRLIILLLVSLKSK